MAEKPQEQHEMVLETIHPSGAEEWYCPRCGRRFLIQWPPAYNKVILDPGDEAAIHSGGKGNPASPMSPLEEDEAQEGEGAPIDEARLKPWIDWMEKVDFEKLWTQDL